MTRHEFMTLVGNQLYHVTPASNAEGIAKLGLLSASELARRANLDASLLTLRAERLEFTVEGFPVALNHQLPLRAGIGKDTDFLCGHSIESWSEQLDNRIFFWTKRSRKNFELSIQRLGPHKVFRIDSARFFDVLSPEIHLSPINSGNARRRPALRGDWLYVSVANTPDAFKFNRATRAKTLKPDRVIEVSVTRPILPGEFEEIRARPSA